MAEQQVFVPKEYVRCNLCRVDSTRPWAVKDGVPIVQCRECSLVYVNPRLDEQQRKQYYGAQYFFGGQYDSDLDRGRMYEMEIEEIAHWIGRSGRFLDVGCAYGRFLSYLPNTFEKYGVEFSEEAAAWGRRNFDLDIRVGELHAVDWPEAFFDIVQFRGVFEHLPDPQRDVETAYRILRPGGWLLLSTVPNVGGPCGWLFKERFKLVYPREHIYYFSRKTLTQYCTKNNFHVVHISYPYLGTPYENLWADLRAFVFNYFTNRDSPPFFRSVISVYARKTCPGFDGKAG